MNSTHPLDPTGTHAEKSASPFTGSTSVSRAESHYPALPRSAGGSLIGRLEQYSRHHPGVVFGGAVVSGLLVAALIRQARKRRESAGEQGFPPPTQQSLRRPRGAGFTQDASNAQGDDHPPVTVRDSSRPRSTGIGLYPGARPVY